MEQNVTGLGRQNPCGLLVQQHNENAVLFDDAVMPGATPLVEVDGVFAKLECTNPCGSVKDRIARYIIDESIRRGMLRPGMRIVEATSGNTGIALSYYAACKGFAVTIVMPENMTEERKRIIRSFGAELILCKAGDFAEAAAIRDRICAEDPLAFNPDQFSNPLNIECHEKTTGAEIIAGLEAKGLVPDAFVAGVGTGGTLIGVARALRRINPEVHIVAVEPSESAVMLGGPAGIHGIQGIGDGFIPAIAASADGKLSPEINEVIAVSTEEATRTAQWLREKHSYCVGISAGANYAAAHRLLYRTHRVFNTVVTMFADGYAKYQSAGLTYCGEGACKHEVPTRSVFRRSPSSPNLSF